MSAREVRLATVGIIILLAAFDLLSRAVPSVAVHLSTIVAATFLYLPVLLLPRSGPGLEAYGLTTTRMYRGLLTGAIVATLFIPPFLVGQHLWATQFEGRVLDPAMSAFRQLPHRLEAGAVPEPRDVPALFKRGDRIEVVWAPNGPWRLELTTDGELTTATGRRLEPAAFERSGQAGTTIHVALHVRGGSQVRARFEVDEAPVPASNLRVPGQRAPPRAWRGADTHSLVLPLSLAWIPLLILVHLLIVALPEELFFRGYLQKRLGESGFQATWKFGCLHLTSANLVASATFALCHLVIGWDPLRLAVFFPSLVFGVLRDQTGGIAAPVICHAMFNLMVLLTVIHYLPGHG